MSEILELGTMSSRGQLCIPTNIREKLMLEEGTKVMLLATDDSLFLKKIDSATFSQLLKPFHDSKKKIKESDVSDVIHALRKKQNKDKSNS
jgi:AbrB family looped-hinge helix DNA binding protein